MKISIIKLVITAGLLVGCGGGGSTPPNGGEIKPSTQEDSVPSKFFNDPLVKKVETFNVDNLPSQLNNISQNDFIEIYKKVQNIQLSGFPDLNNTFDLNVTSEKSLKVINKNQKIIYENTWSRKDSYNCIEGGTVSKEVDLTPRGHLDADTYIEGDNTTYQYDRCDYGNITYNGGLTYRVKDFTKFDYTFGAIPLGRFTSNFNHMSIETDTQKVTLDGGIEFTAIAKYTPEPNASLISLEIKYQTIGDFIVTVYDKSTGETTKLIYNGLLEKIVYDKASASTSATSIDVATNSLNYRKTSDYTLALENGTKIAILDLSDNISGVVNSDGSIDIRPIGYDNINVNTSFMQVGLHQILHMNLADGSSRYIFDNNTDYFPDENSVDGGPKHTLPPSDVDLMNGIVVIGFDTCLPTTLLRNNLEELGIDYKYVNIEASQKEYDVFRWFNISGVPYVGISGNYFGAAGYDKNTTELILNLYGYDMNDTVVEETRRQSASVKLEGWLETLQSEPIHTAMAVAIDTPYLYQAGWVWSRSSKEEAQNAALSGCEKLRSERVDNEKEAVLSPCKIYSIDGVKQ